MGNALYRKDVSIISGSANTFSCGQYHSMIIKADGTLWAVGLNDKGQLGLEDNTNRDVLTQVGVLITWKAVYCGDLYTFALKNDGTMWSTGYNSFHGQLGLGDEIDRNVFTQVGDLTTWETIACAIYNTSAIKSDGTLWVVGYNAYGRLGLGDAVNRSTFTQVGDLTTWKSVSRGFYHTAAIKTDGTLWVVGMGSDGELGLGNWNDVNVFTQVGALTTWESVSCGSYYTSAIMTDGTLWSTGENSSGQLGIGNTTGKNVFTQVGDLTTWKAIYCGTEFNFALKIDGTLWSTGRNSDGQLGLGDKINKNVFTQVGILTTWKGFSCRRYHTLTIIESGALWTTGYNGYGELCLGDIVYRSILTDTGFLVKMAGGTSTPLKVRRRSLKERTVAGERRVRSFYELDDRVAIVGEEWSPFISVDTSRQFGNMCATSDGRAIVSYILSDICYVAFADSISLVLGGTVGFGSDIVIKTGVLGKGSGQPAGVSVNNIDGKLHMVIYYYDSVADNFKAEFWSDSTGLGGSFVFVTFISESLMGAGITLFYGPAIISYIIKSSGGNLIVLLPYMSDFYTMAYYTMRSYYSSDGGLSWTLGGSVPISYYNTYFGGNLLELPNGSIITCASSAIYIWSNSGASYLGGYGWANFPDTGHMFAPGFVITLTGAMFLYCYNNIFKYSGPIMATTLDVRDGNNWTIIHDGVTTGSITFRGLLCDNIILIQDVGNGPSHLYCGSYLSTIQEIRHRINLG